MRKHHIYEKDYILNTTTCSCKSGKYLASIIDDSVVMCGEIKEETKTVPTNFNEKKKGTFKTRNFYILLPFL